MKNKRLISLFLISSLFTVLCVPAFSETAEPYKEDEFPQALKDIRRFEIISLGSMPFVLLDTNLVYSSYLWVKNDFSSAYSPNPFASSSNTYSTEEMTGLILTSLGISVSIGLTDFIVNHLKRIKSKKSQNIKNDNIDIYEYIPIEDDPDAVKIETDGMTPASQNEKNGNIPDTSDDEITDVSETVEDRLTEDFVEGNSPVWESEPENFSDEAE